MSRFYYDVVLPENEICNLFVDREFLASEIARGSHIVFSGRRNTGKTSLMKSVVIPQFRKSHPKALILFIDLMGVRSVANITARIRQSFTEALNEVQTVASLIKNFGKTLRTLRPNMTIDPLSGEPSFGFQFDETKNTNDNLKEIFKQIGTYHLKSKALVVIDEFQDISEIPEAEGLIREALQNLPAHLPVVLMGSKKHMLTKIFSTPNAPLAGWGKFREISSISTKDYHKYIQNKFSESKVEFPIEVTAFLQEKVQNIPECVNLVCDQIQRNCQRKKKISNEDVIIAITTLLNEKSSLFEEKLSFLSEKENTFLVALAKNEPLLQPTSHTFLRIVRMSPGGIRPLLKRLENQAIVYKGPDGYRVGDPLLSWYLKKHR